MRAHYASRLRIGLDVSAIVLCALAGLYFWGSALRWLSLVLFTLSGALGLILFAAFAVIPQLAFYREPKLQDEYSITFSDEGIHFKTSHIDSQLQWNLYSSVLIDGGCYILYYGKNSFTVIPMRAFERIEAQTAFEQLLTKHISKIVRK